MLIWKNRSPESSFPGPMVVAGEDDDDEDREVGRDLCGSRVWSGQNWGWTSL